MFLPYIQTSVQEQHLDKLTKEVHVTIESSKASRMATPFRPGVTFLPRLTDP